MLTLSEPHRAPNTAGVCVMMAVDVQELGGSWAGPWLWLLALAPSYKTYIKLARRTLAQSPPESPTNFRLGLPEKQSLRNRVRTLLGPHASDPS